MLGRHYHECDAEHGVGSRRVNAELFVGAFQREVNESALGAAYPVLLLELYVREVVDLF